MNVGISWFGLISTIIGFFVDTHFGFPVIGGLLGLFGLMVFCIGLAGNREWLTKGVENKMTVSEGLINSIMKMDKFPYPKSKNILSHRRKNQ